MSARSGFATGLALALALAAPAWAGDSPDPPAPAPPQPDSILIDGEAVPLPKPRVVEASPVAPSVVLPAGTRSGVEIYRNFREGLADPVCEPGASARWRQHFAHAPGLFASPRSDVLPLFGYVVDRLREAHLPTEYALIPFVESGYKPGARSPQGPAGLWQFIALTARNQKVAVGPGYDGRLSPVDSTEAAVRYLRTLHGMFAGDWRLAVMAYNAGEYRLLGALKRAGQRPASADPATLPMPPITMAYVRKLHALSCIFEEADDRDAWLQALDRPVPVLAAAEVPAGIATLDALATRHGADATQLRRLNPAFGDGRIARVQGTARVLLPSAHAPVAVAAVRPPPAPVRKPSPTPASGDPDDMSDAMADASAHVVPEAPARVDAPPRTHTVARGDSAWKIARRYGIPGSELLSRNGLDARSVLQPGMVLAIDPPRAGTAATAVAE
ncbi:LysM peptidoglycan-binding domain-containing protein [Luteimonas marina]|uniref:LysM peptidoglycan-binding domain-containing protein n=1 Tax=Luteimonas marina TaxID=488485 RepID=A0A5C5U4U4_9GAMM|nr:lytic transglycosylase domain-containing protein [Luteimonas marina]TWT21391.1 LysM peptidoglycan-binding domain-containing protein [Luteimonas marina]